MAVLGLDLGGTKLATAIFNRDGNMINKEILYLEGRKGKEVGALIHEHIIKMLDGNELRDDPVRAIGISVPGIYYANKKTVWAPNIPEWDDYPLYNEVNSLIEGKNITVAIDSDRACYILGETERGAAKGCKDAIFLAIGTGIGAGILVDGKILRGTGDIAGAVGWMALSKPYMDDYKSCGCFECHASGSGITRKAKQLVDQDKGYSGLLREHDEITTPDIFNAYKQNDPIAIMVLREAIEYWGMAVANLVSIFNPEKIIFGGGVFGPAAQFINQIKQEALQWSQPISITQAKIEVSPLGDEAGLIGAGKLALMEME